MNAEHQRGLFSGGGSVEWFHSLVGQPTRLPLALVLYSCNCGWSNSLPPKWILQQDPAALKLALLEMPLCAGTELRHMALMEMGYPMWAILTIAEDVLSTENLELILRSLSVLSYDKQKIWVHGAARVAESICRHR